MIPTSVSINDIVTLRPVVDVMTVGVLKLLGYLGVIPCNYCISQMGQLRVGEMSS